VGLTAVAYFVGFGLQPVWFGQLLEKCRAEAATRGGRKKFHFRNKLVSLDGSIIDLSAAMFDWAHYRRTKGAIKLHLLLDHDGYLPSFAVVTEGKRSELEVARSLRLEAGTILVVDRGYNDYAWFAEMTCDGVFFVTRMKTSTVYVVEQECEVPQKSNVLRDQIVSLPSLENTGEEPILFRRIQYWNQDKQEILVFFTNLLHLSAATIPAIYKDRWQIELFFENPTWCTPSYVICFQKANSWNLPAVGCCLSIVGRGIAPLPI
jgi:Transposase DDE domain